MSLSRIVSPSVSETQSRWARSPNTLSLDAMPLASSPVRDDSMSLRLFTTFLSHAGPDATFLPSLRKLVCLLTLKVSIPAVLAAMPISLKVDVFSSRNSSDSSPNSDILLRAKSARFSSVVPVKSQPSSLDQHPSCLKKFLRNSEQTFPSTKTRLTARCFPTRTRSLYSRHS